MRRFIKMAGLLCVLLLLVGCGSEKEDATAENTGYELYYINAERTRIEKKRMPLEMTTDISAILENVIHELFYRETTEEEERPLLLPNGVELLDYNFEDQVLWLNFNEAYSKLDRTDEVLIRASAVRTCVQIPDVEYVGFQIEGERMKDSYGREVRLMDSNSFMENSGKEINTYQMAEMTLYFANANGDGLTKEERSVYYSTSMPIERAVMEQLLKGPRDEGSHATIPSETKILGVTVAENVCYVNLSQEFSDMALNQAEQVPIYSITNSLVESGTVDEVQISINGETNLTYREDISLNQLFKKNEELVTDEDTE